MPENNKVNIHWMLRFDADAPRDLQTLSNVLDYSGYYSVLTVYHSKLPDYWLKISNIINKEHELKYMIAMRTYAISPEYCAMMCEGFNTIDRNRLMLNIAAGDLHAEEKSVNDVVDISDKIDTHEKRTEYTARWLEKFFDVDVLKNKPEIIVSGTSDQTIENANRYADAHLSMYSSYSSGLKSKILTKRKMVSCSVVIRNSEEEALSILPDNDGEMIKNSTIYGTEEQVIKRIESMEEEGITDLLITRRLEDKEPARIHQMVRRLTGGR